MKIDFNRPVLNEQDEPVQEKGKVETLYSMCRFYLFVGGKDDRVDLQKAEKCYDVRKKIQLLVPTDLKAEDIVLIKERVAAVCAVPGMVGQISSMLNDEWKEPKVESESKSD